MIHVCGEYESRILRWVLNGFFWIWAIINHFLKRFNIPRFRKCVHPQLVRVLTEIKRIQENHINVANKIPFQKFLFLKKVWQIDNDSNKALSMLICFHNWQILIDKINSKDREPTQQRQIFPWWPRSYPSNRIQAAAKIKKKNINLTWKWQKRMLELGIV